MLKINLREFANLPEEKVLKWRGMRLKAEVTDDLGEKRITDTYALMLTWQGLIVHRHYNDVPYSVKEVIPSNIIYDSDSLSNINYVLGIVMPNLHDPVELDFIKRLVAAWQNKLNNLITVMSEEYAVSATAEDVMEVYDHKDIAKIRRRVKAGEITIDEGEDLFSDVMRNAPDLNHSVFTLLVRTGGVSINQGYQKLVARGAVFDLNNNILPNPIEDCYAEGIVNLTDSMGDSKAAGVSLDTNGAALSTSEWWHRKSHVFAAVMSTIRYTEDCGSPVHLPMTISDKAMAMSCIGKYMKGPNGPVLIDHAIVKTIKTGDVIEIRSVAFCDSGKQGQPCGICYGALKSTVPYNVMTKKSANIGMYNATNTCNPIGQKMLSTKHFIRNAITRAFEVDKRDQEIFKTDGDTIFLQESLCAPGTEIILRNSITNILTDLAALDSLDELALHNLPYFTEVTFKFSQEDVMVGGVTTVQHSAKTHVASRRGRISIEFLEYILETGWEIIDKKYISVRLDKWTHKAPMFTLPFIREGLDKHQSDVESFLTFSRRNNAWKRQNVTPQVFAETLTEFWHLINKETKGTNMVQCEVMLSAALTNDPESLDYGLPTDSSKPRYFTPYMTCVFRRGTGTLMIAEDQQTQLNNVDTYMLVNKPPSVLEGFFQPIAR